MNQDWLVAGQKLSQVFHQCLKAIKPGCRLAEIDHLADQLIQQVGAKPSFKTVTGYQWATCINVNEGVVHGIPHPTIIVKAGDLVSLDIGLIYRGWNVDMAYTIKVQNQKDKEEEKQQEEKFLEAGKKALEEAIKMVRPGNRVGHISAAIEQIIEGNGYHCVRSLTGHGIGRQLHQEPWVPCLLVEPIEQTPELKEGMGLAIEVIYTMGKPELKKLADGWTIATQDGKISALFEKTVLVTRKGGKVITPFIWEE